MYLDFNEIVISILLALVLVSVQENSVQENAMTFASVV